MPRWVRPLTPFDFCAGAIYPASSAKGPGKLMSGFMVLESSLRTGGTVPPGASLSFQSQLARDDVTSGLMIGSSPCTSAASQASERSVYACCCSAVDS